MKLKENRAQNIMMQRKCVITCKRNSDSRVTRTLQGVWYKYRKNLENTLWEQA